LSINRRMKSIYLFVSVVIVTRIGQISSLQILSNQRHIAHSARLPHFHPIKIVPHRLSSVQKKWLVFWETYNGKKTATVSPTTCDARTPMRRFTVTLELKYLKLRIEAFLESGNERLEREIISGSISTRTLLQSHTSASLASTSTFRCDFSTSRFLVELAFYRRKLPRVPKSSENERTFSQSTRSLRGILHPR
jgi:hypothetical protein